MTAKKWTYLVAGLVLVAIGSFYLLKANFFKQHFLPKTSANGVNISKMTVKEAEKALSDKYSGDTFEITDNGEVWRDIPTKDLGIDHDFTDKLTEHLKKQSANNWLIKSFSTKKLKLSESSLNKENFELFSKQLKKDLASLNNTKTQSVNAYIKQADSAFEIIPEVEGDTINTDNVVHSLSDFLTQGKTALELNSFLDKPTVKKDDPTLQDKLKEITKISEQPVTYQINGKTIEVPQDTVASWIQFDPTEQNVTINTELAQTYISELGDKYDTSENETTFKSTKHGKVSVPAGTYSWTIQPTAEAEELKLALLEGNGVDRSPIAMGSASIGQPLIGDTYVEIDLDNQHMYFYKDGKLELDTDIVSGKPTTVTPKGVHYLWKKERDSVLRGTNDDGSTYAEPVSYWMPIDWTGVGIHDSPWQDKYGGKRWKEGFGSHGCINTPPDIAAKLFNSIDEGTPVIVF